MGDTFSTPTAIAAFLSTGLISLAPNLIFFLLPGYKEGDSSIWLSMGQAMAAGGLMGDVFLHTLNENSDGLWVLGGFTMFLTADILIRSLQNDDSSDKRSMVILNLAADALHNWTDGLAIGASFSMVDQASAHKGVWSLVTSHSRGGIATLSIALHEIPHELGDVCTLIRAGYSTRQAICAQLLTAVAAFFGTATAIAVSRETWAEERLLWMTAGGFVYLACTTILPEVLGETGGDLGKQEQRLLRFAQLASFCTGIALLYAVVLFEEGDESVTMSHHHSHHHHHTAEDSHHKELHSEL